MTLRTRTLALSAALFAQSMFGVTPTFAQEAAPAAQAPKDEGGVEIITVTARRKEENIQDIPIAVSAFSADDLATSNIDDVSDVQFNVPNLKYSKTNFSGAGNIAIRGVGNLATAGTSENGTGIHINDAPFPGSRIFETEFYDVGSVQVLRGPQGTLFGRSSPGGALNIYTKKPVLEEWGGYAGVDYGDYNHAKVRAALNVPLGEHFAARVAGYFFRRDGITKDLNSGKDIDGREVYALRASLYGEWDDANFNLMAQYFRGDDNRMRISNQGCTPDATDWPNGIGCLGGNNRLQRGGINYNSTLAYSSGIISDTFNALAGTPRFLSGPQALFTPYLLANPTAAGYFFSNPCTVGGGCPGYVLDNATASSIFGANPNTWGLPSLYFNGSNRPRSLRKVNTQLVPRYVADEVQITFTANFDLTEELALTSVTGWHRAFVNSYTDYWWATADVNFSGGSRTFGFPDSPFANRSVPSEFVFDRSRSTDQFFTQEVRLVSSFDGRFNFQAGLIYNDGKARGIYDVYGASLEAFWDTPGDPVGLCPAAAAITSVGGTCYDAAPETSYYRNFGAPTLQSYALFGETYFELTDTTRLTVGGRYTDDIKTDDQTVNLWVCNPNTGDPSTGKICGRDPITKRRGGWTEFIWKVSVDQHFDLPWAPESLLYATVSTGYKGGGFNPAVSAQQTGGTAGQVPPTFKPEQILAYEIGYKGLWWDQLQVGFTGFYYDYTDMQIGKIVNRTAVNENIDSKIYGVEFETVWQATEAIRFDMNVSWLESKIGKGRSIDGADPTQGQAGWLPIKQLLPFPAGQNAICNPTINPYCIDPIGVRGTGFGALAGTIVNPGGECLTAPLVGAGALADLIAANPNLCGYVADGFAANLKGNELPTTPNWNIKVGAQYALPAMRGWVATPRLDFYWNSEMWGRVYNTGKDYIPSWQQLDANMTITKDGSPWMFELWAKNLQDNNDITGHYFTDPTSANFTNLFILEPRTFGATIRYTFGESEY